MAFQRGVPRGLPAASLKLVERMRLRLVDKGVPRGLPAASLKPRLLARRTIEELLGVPRGLPAASLKPGRAVQVLDDHEGCSAGTSRGLIEVRSTASWTSTWRWCSAGTSRGLIEVSLEAVTKPVGVGCSAGTSRGLIEAMTTPTMTPRTEPGVPRGLPAASLKLRSGCRSTAAPGGCSAGTSRGLIEATNLRAIARPSASVFRGDFPRPH